MNTQESKKHEQQLEDSFMLETSINQSAMSMNQSSINTTLLNDSIVNSQQSNSFNQAIANMSIDNSRLDKSKGQQGKMININQSKSGGKGQSKSSYSKVDNSNMLEKQQLSIEQQQQSSSFTKNNSEQLQIVDIGFEQESIHQQSQYSLYLKDLEKEMPLEQFMQKLSMLSKSAVSVKERKMTMGHVEKHIDLLTVQYPDELQFLKQALNNNLILIVQKFKRIFPIKSQLRSYEKKLAAVIQRYKNNYKHYNLKDPQPGVYSKYLKLDLSYKVNINVGKIINCKWQNLIQLNLKYCEITDQGWDYIVSVIPNYNQLRKLNLALNMITTITQEDIKPFALLPHFMQIDIRHNPFNKYSFSHLYISQKFAKGKFSFLFSRLDYSLDMIKIQSFLKLDRQQLKLMQKIQWVHKALNCAQWDLIVHTFRLFQSIRTINFSNNAIKTITLKHLQDINGFVERRLENKRLTIILQQNPLTQQSIDAIKQFYAKYRWSQACIQHENFTTEYHNDRLRNSLIKNKIFYLHYLIIKNRQDDAQIDAVDELMDLIENELSMNPLNEVRDKKYLDEVFEYVMGELDRVYGKGKLVKYTAKFVDVKKKFFSQYENIERFENSNVMMMKQEELE